MNFSRNSLSTINTEYLSSLGRYPILAYRHLHQVLDSHRGESWMRRRRGVRRRARN